MRTRRYRVGVAFALLLSAVCQVPATPVTTGAAVRAFLGGRSGKLVYTRWEGADSMLNGRMLCYVDFSDSALVERTIIQYPGSEPRNPFVSPDGAWIAYNTITRNADTYSGSTIHTCALTQNAGDDVTLGAGAIPWCWQRPGSAELYLIYVDADLEEGRWQMVFPPALVYGLGGGVTYCQRIDPALHQAIGAAQQLLSYYVNGGRSSDGAWMFTAGGKPGTFHVDSAAVADITPSEMVAYADSIEGCNPSMSPDQTPSAVRTLHLQHDHRGYYICTVRGQVLTNPQWTTDGGNTYMDMTQWSNHTDFAAITASPGNVVPPFDVYLLRLTNNARIKVLDGNYAYPYLWVSSSSGATAPHARPGAGALRVRYVAGRLCASEAEASSVAVYDCRGAFVSSAQLDAAGWAAVRLAAGRYLLRVAGPGRAPRSMPLTVAQ